MISRYLKKIFIWGITLIGLQIVLPPDSFAQNYQEFVYKDGRIRGILPYGEPFLIKGNREQPGASGKANVVQLTVFEEENPRRRRRRNLRRKNKQPKFNTDPYYATTWWANDPVNDKQFELYVATPLQLSTAYNFRFNFFHKYELDDPTTKRLVTAVKTELLKEFDQNGTQSIRIDVINRFLNQKVAQFADSLNFGYLDSYDNGEVEFTTTARELKVPFRGTIDPELAEAIGNVIRDELSLLDEAPVLETIENEIRALSSRPGYIDLLDKLKSLRQTNPDLPKMYSDEDIKALETFVNDLRIIDVNLFSTLIDFARANPSELSAAQQSSLARLRSSFNDLTNYTKSRQEKVARIRLIEQRFGRGGLDKLIGDGFILANSTEVISTPFTGTGTGTNRRVRIDSTGNNNVANFASAVPGENDLRTTGYDAINIGTAYGVALVGLNFGTPNAGETGFTLENTEPEMISYVAAKFYLNPIDKSVPYPYPRFTDKFAILAGIKATGDLNFKGQIQKNVFKVQPVLGLSYDLTRAVSVEVGGIFFNEPSLSPFTAVERLRVAPFFGMSVDANAFNVIKNLLNPLTEKR
ncbi:MAG: hypothetical protein KDD99_02550 [Bacteroidetes bacterium]|nr:hypothetical protein [Bacteroidota bacterium]